ncbi:membrane protein insertase YidC [Labilibaculum euxinus]|uniref:Membrane protein insertase YidC n=1 Tax=Labilibaculum euxinus TaxID=2686357 RepID=A0A7M4D709_9BACT|nr:membrane protein insertase YidC [Labilibaculum euxinus]MUP38438.1 membrane protein insertase YidC [Labilibaculum euxinus]MVB07643.1 membrane protein insertase YidC [Labilibaculum euxinus]
MDRNSIFGLLIIGAILIGYTYLTKPSEEEIKAINTRDSIARVDRLHNEEIEAARLEGLKTQYAEVKEDTVATKETYGAFSGAVNQKEEFITLENKLVKLTLNTRGGRIQNVQLKEFQTHDSLPLLLWAEKNSKFGLTFYSENKPMSTQDLFFVEANGATSVNATTSEKGVSMRLMVGDDKYIEYKYTLAPDSYMVDFTVNLVGMQDVISRNSNFVTFNWQEDIPRQEKGRKFENQYTALYYKFFEDEVDNLSITGDKEEDLATKVKWIGFKQQFFSSVLIADDAFKGVKLKSVDMDENSPILKNFSAEISLPYEGTQLETHPMKFYFGPNKFNTLREYGKNLDGHDIQLHKLINLGWSIFGWINRYFVIPIFNFLEGFISNYGIIILILTIIIKLLLAPLTYKSYMSTAKMKVLKPQIDAINEKIPKDKAMERQQATMALYKKAGVNPMGGCLPMLVQFPFLIALFRFFPASFELRQQSFLWAKDLSSYDSILTLPWNIPWYGDHVSLFCLLMAGTNLVYTSMNGQMQSSNQMPGMKYMMYLMPVMFLGWFNNYASGLSYYYFIATLFTVLQTIAIRKFMVDDDKVLAMLEANKKKPVKKSKFQQRLEEAAKQRGKK